MKSLTPDERYANGEHSDHQVVDFSSLPDGQYAIEGLAHLTLSEGSVIRITRAKAPLGLTRGGISPFVRPYGMTVDYSPTFGRKQRTELLPDGTVQVTVHSYGTEHVYRVGSAELSPHYSTYRDTKLGSLIGAAILLILSALAFLFRFPSQSSGSGDEWPHIYVGSILLSMAALILASWPFQKVDVVLFMDRDRKRSLLSIPRKSSPSEFDAFIKKLVSKIPPQ